MRSRNQARKNVEQIKPIAESQHDTDEFELARILDETLSLMKSQIIFLFTNSTRLDFSMSHFSVIFLKNSKHVKFSLFLLYDK